MDRAQPDLFDAPPDLPPGFRYAAEVITPAEERELAERLATLPFAPFEFQGYLGRRRVVSFGWRYDFNHGGLHPAAPVPDFLLPLRDRAGAVAGLDPPHLAHVLVTEYAPGAGIGWHRDRPHFDVVVGVSLLAPCRLRLRRREGAGWKRAAADLAPRSAYVLDGEVRASWEHSIPPLDALRYSITFRSVRPAAGGPS